MLGKQRHLRLNKGSKVPRFTVFLLAFLAGHCEGRYAPSLVLVLRTFSRFGLGNHKSNSRKIERKSCQTLTLNRERPLRPFQSRQSLIYNSCSIIINIRILHNIISHGTDPTLFSATADWEKQISARDVVCPLLVLSGIYISIS